jgi:hypothetical protein
MSRRSSSAFTLWVRRPTTIWKQKPPVSTYMLVWARWFRRLEGPRGERLQAPPMPAPAAERSHGCGSGPFTRPGLLSAAAANRAQAARRSGRIRGVHAAPGRPAQHPRLASAKPACDAGRRGIRCTSPVWRAPGTPPPRRPEGRARRGPPITAILIV